ncbi:MAG: hypothetical protein J6A75_07305 [Lachnospiraceae bacterium]|nr:hypothetical protein [Lachnospiraceae bacterium]
MTATEIILLIIGVVFFVASFFITEKLIPGELNKIGDLSKDELRRIMEREVQKLSGKLESQVEEKAEEVLLKAERSMEKESNEKIMAISEYSDTVMESMNKTHNEIMFLYSMLNDKHAELTQFSSKLQEVASDMNRRDSEIEKQAVQRTAVSEAQAEMLQDVPELQAVKEVNLFTEQMTENLEEWFTEKEESNHNDAILALHKEGKSGIEIAKQLALGIGEVQLVISLYEGNKK